MIQTITFIMMMICFIGTIYGSEKYFQKHEPTLGVWKLMAITILSLFVIMTIVVLIPVLFPILIYMSIILASFVSVYCRHRMALRKDFN